MILFVAVLVGIGVALLRGGSLRSLADVPLRLGWLAVLSFLAQAYVIFTPADQLEAQRGLGAATLMGSYAALVLVVWGNRRMVGMPILGLGLLLNLVVMGANGGFMPITREVILAAGTHPVADLPVDGARLPRAKDIVLPADRTNLPILSDVIVATAVPVAKVYSVGDLIVALGAFVLLQAAIVPSEKRRIQGRNEAKIA